MRQERSPRVPHRGRGRTRGSRSAQVHSSLDLSQRRPAFHGVWIKAAGELRSPGGSETSLHDLAEAGVPELLPIVWSIYVHNAAHLAQPRTHAFTDAIAQSRLLRSLTPRTSDPAGSWPILKVGCDNGRAVLVVASVQDDADSVPNPPGRLLLLPGRPVLSLQFRNTGL